jgi:hypothetical protein
VNRPPGLQRLIDNDSDRELIFEARSRLIDDLLGRRIPAAQMQPISVNGLEVRWQVGGRDSDLDRRLDVQIEEIAVVSKDVRSGIKAKLDRVEHGGLGRIPWTNEAVDAGGWRLFQLPDAPEVLHFHMDDTHSFPRLYAAVGSPNVSTRPRCVVGAPPAPFLAHHNARAFFRSSCSKSLAILLISEDRAPTAAATVRQSAMRRPPRE